MLIKTREHIVVFGICLFLVKSPAHALATMQSVKIGCIMLVAAKVALSC